MQRAGMGWKSEMSVSRVYGNKIRGNTESWADLAGRLSVSARRGLERRVDWPDEIVPACECGEASAPAPSPLPHPSVPAWSKKKARVLEPAKTKASGREASVDELKSSRA